MNTRMVAALAALVVVFLVALAGVFGFAQEERARDLQQIRSQLSIVANSRAQALEQWLDQQREVLSGLLNNESLQLYLNVIRMQAEDNDSLDDAAELEYLRTLLNATAQRSGFVSRVDAAPVPANVKRLGLAGLALLAPDGQVLVASAGMPPIQGELAAFVAETPLAEPGFLDLRRDAQGQVALGWLLPVLTEQGESLQAEVTARLLALRPADARFFATLEQPGETAATAETYLIRQDGNTLEYLSPLEDGTAPLSQRIAVGDQRSVDAAALRAPGAFHEGLDYSATPVFAVSRRIPGTPWVLVHQVDQREALLQGERRRQLLVTVLVAILIGVAATILLVWRFATSARVEQAAREYRASSERFEGLSRFLDAVSDTQPHAIFATDAQSRLTFANRRTAELTGIPKDELPGRSLLGALGQDRGTVYQQLAKEVQDQQQERVETRTFVAATGDWDGAEDANANAEHPLAGAEDMDSATAAAVAGERAGTQEGRQDGQEGRAQAGEPLVGREEVWRSYHYPLPEVGDHQAAVLTTIEDLTTLTEERRRRERNTRNLIDTLVGLVDERDPDSAHQSLFVAQVAREIATEMGLEPALVETADQAGSLGQYR